MRLIKQFARTLLPSIALPLAPPVALPVALPVAVGALTMLCAPAHADVDFTGVYRAPGTNNGPTLTLSVRQDAQGNATGTITSSGGANPPMQLRGKLSEKQGDKQVLMGSIHANNQFAMFFLMEKLNGKLTFYFIPSTPDGKPDFAKWKPTTFNILPAGGNNASPNNSVSTTTVPSIAAGNSPYLGTFKNGPLTLSLRKDGEAYKGTLTGNGVTYNLDGYPENNGGLFGKLTTPGEGTNYFKLQKQNNQLVLSMIKAGADGDPDFEKKSDVTFPAAPTTSTGGTVENGGTTPNTTVVSGANPFNGTFKSDNMVLESKRDGDQYTGTIQFGGQTFEFTARERNGALVGAFKTDDGQFDFTANLQGGTLALTTGGTTHRLNKQGGNPLAGSNNPLAGSQPVNPLGNAQGNGTGNDTTNGANANDNWKSFTNAQGVSLKHPSNWTVKDVPGSGTILMPPDPASNEQGPLEAYMVLGVPATGVKSIDDPLVIKALDMQMKAMLPALKRAGNVERLKSGNTSGIHLRWEGRNPNSGLIVSAHLYTSLINGQLATLAAMGTKNNIAARDAILRNIFSSFDVQGGLG